jgi:signal transduction histidine kinase
MWRTRMPAVAGAGLICGLLVWATAMTALEPSTRAIAYLAVGLVTGPLYAATGLLVVRHAPGNRVGALLVLTGLVVAFTVTKEVGWMVLATSDAAESWGWLVAGLEESAWWGFVVLALVFLYFPDGRLPGRRWRWLPPLLVSGAAVIHVRGLFGEQPFRAPLEQVPRPLGAPPAWLELASAVGVFVVLGSVLVAAVSPWVRGRRGDLVLRRQVRWLALAGAGVPVFPVLCLVEIAVSGRPLWASLAVGVFAVVTVPVAVAVAMIRHELYDVDTVFAATLTWAALTTTLVSLYLALSWAVGTLAGGSSALAAAAATAACAVVLQPLRAWLQSRVDEVAYPLRRGAFQALAALRERVDRGRARPEELESVLREALRDPGLRVGYAVPGADHFLDVDAKVVPAEGAVPVAVDGSPIGILRAQQERAASPVLLRQVAERAVGLVELVCTRQELARLVDEVAASRKRLVQAAFDERRRLERDLHDGAQQRLVSLGMAMRTAQRRLRRARGRSERVSMVVTSDRAGPGTGPDDSVDVDALLERSVAELGTVVAELRQIAHGIRPSTLDDGLRPALTALARDVPLEVEVDVRAGPLDDDVATTAYFVVSEALANALKHAEARLVVLQVHQESGSLLVRVRDDGRGGASLGPGSAIADRVAAMGGQLRVDAPPAGGTLVEVRLPCA